jgi:hypothetical protein
MSLSARKIEFVILPAEAVPLLAGVTGGATFLPSPGTPDLEYRRNDWCPGCDVKLPPWQYSQRQCRRCGYAAGDTDIV